MLSLLALFSLLAIAVYFPLFSAHAGVIFTVLIAPASIVYDGKKSLNGTVLSHNHYGSIGRARVKPKNPKTESQMAVRAGMTNSSKAWRP